MGNDNEPAGGWDKTPLHPSRNTTYTVRIVFHGADNLPIADIPQRSSDPYVLAQLTARSETNPEHRYGARHAKDPYLRFRSATVYASLEPRWEAEWIVAGVPCAGFKLNARVWDEDNGTKDDRLGKVELASGALSAGWKWEHEAHELRKRGGSVRAWGMHAVRSVLPGHGGETTLSISMEVLGKTEDECGKMYTLNSYWWIHYSPLMGVILGTTSSMDGKEKANFQANQLQLRGPVPNELYHRYVEFKSFVRVMFESRGLGGHMLHGALHSQHERVYHFDNVTEYGKLPGPGKAMAQRFLDMAHWGEGFRIFTYVITLDGLMRFTETGKEFAVDMLSKHTMHSDVNIYVAFAGEFFVRKWKGGRHNRTESRANTGEVGANGSACGAITAHGAQNGHVKGPKHADGEQLQNGNGHGNQPEQGDAANTDDATGSKEQSGTADSSDLDYDAPSHSMLRTPKDVDTADGVVEEHRHDHHLVHSSLRSRSRSKSPNPDKSKDGPSPAAGTPCVGPPDLPAVDRLTLAPPEISDSPLLNPNPAPTPGRHRRRSSFFRSKKEPKEDTTRPKETNTLHGPDEAHTLDPTHYELVVDNDSGTYRPNKATLPLLRAFLAANFVGVHVTVRDSQDAAYQALKKERRKERRRRGKGVVYAESESDISSLASDSDRHDSDDDDDSPVNRGGREKGIDLVADPKGAVKGGVRGKIDKIKGLLHRDRKEGESSEDEDTRRAREEVREEAREEDGGSGDERAGEKQEQAQLPQAQAQAQAQPPPAQAHAELPVQQATQE